MEKTITCLILIFSISIIFYISCKMYITLFELTGLSRKKAKFQVLTIFMSVGYSTSESELIMYDSTRRKIALACMLNGYIFFTLLTSLIFGIIASLDFSAQVKHEYTWTILKVLFICIGVLIVFVLITEIPVLKRFTRNFLRKLLKKRKSQNNNIITITDYFYTYAVATIELNKTPQAMKGKTLTELNLERFNIKILAYSKKDESFVVNITGEEILDDNQVLKVYGDPVWIRKIFMSK